MRGSIRELPGLGWYRSLFIPLTVMLVLMALVSGCGDGSTAEQGKPGGERSQSSKATTESASGGGQPETTQKSEVPETTQKTEVREQEVNEENP